MNQYTNKYTENDYIDKCNELHLTYKGFSKHKKKGVMISFICPIHSDKGIQTKDWSHFKSYAKGCSYCTGRHKTNDEVQRDIKDKNVELISEYFGNEKPIKCRCKLCGNIWTTLPKVLVTNGSGCPTCGIQKRSKSRMKTHDDFVKELNIINSDIMVVGTYSGSHNIIKCECKICGNIWKAYPSNLLNRSAACPNCNISNGEREMVQAIRELGFDIQQQKTIRVDGFNRPLRIDAYDQVNNLAFEYNGEQHYRPVDFAGKGELWANEEYKKTLLRDAAKFQYFKNCGILCVIVPYWERCNIKNYLINKLKELKIGIKT